MSSLLALLTSDPNLLRCELARLEAPVLLADGAVNALARGIFAPEDVLLERFKPGTLPRVRDLVPENEVSPALLFHSRALPIGLSLEENTQPFRFRRWLFAHQGSGLGWGVPDFARLRVELLGALPDYLRRAVRSDTDSEIAFLYFLGRLRELGRTEDSTLTAAEAGRVMGEAMDALVSRVRDAGSREAVMNAAASNGRILVAHRRGAPLHYTVLEGSDRCERCGLKGSEPEAHPLVRAHRRRKSVVVASHLREPRGWVELTEGQTLAVEASLDFRVV